MSSIRHRLHRKFSPLRFDLVAAVAGLVLALLLFPLRFFASQIYIKTVPPVLGVACLLYLVASYGETSSSTGLPSLSPGIQRTLPILVFGCLSLLVLLSVRSGGRSLLFYDVAGVTGTLLFGQIVFASDNRFDAGRVLIQIVLLAAVVRLSAVYANPGLIGIDIWTHITRLAQDIQTSGSLEAISDDKHVTSPLYHLLVVGTSLLAAVPLREALYLTLGLTMPISIVAVYISANLLIEQRWAVLACLLFSLGDYVIEWGIHLIPTSMGLMLFLGVLYLSVRVMRTDYGFTEFGLLVLFSVGIILTHQVSSFIMLVLLGSGVVAYLLLKLDVFGGSASDSDAVGARNPVNLLGLVAFDAGLAAFLWSFTPYNGNSFLVTVMSYLQETLASSAGVLNLAGPDSGASSGAAAAASGPSLIETIVTYVNTTGFLLLLFGTFVGSLYVLHRRRARQSVFTLLVSAAVMLVFVLGLPMFGIRNFIPQRWFAFLYAPMVILTVIGLRYFSLQLNRYAVVGIVLVFAVVFPSVMLISSNGTIDNPAFEDQQASLAYSQAEIDAVHTIGRMTGSPEGDDIRRDQVLFTDHPYQTLFFRTESYPADTATINDSEPVTHDIVVYRQEQTRAATYFLNSRGVGEIRNIHPNRLCRPSRAVVYTNDEVSMCVASPAT
ncbi:DUF2206 domain-containing protein [Halorientalis salina]|uniref:DUF2206 domain-containing protein n=1 Tax=Halorientalis salina TaxID=2932266 RepID=UPI002022A5B3|nr:DUF2206 domain-containing protein [Halorientalis salina]